MAAEDDDPAASADRLEAALERIVRAAAEPKAMSDTREGGGDGIVLAQVAARLDSLIARLRDEVGGSA